MIINENLSQQEKDNNSWADLSDLIKKELKRCGCRFCFSEILKYLNKYISVTSVEEIFVGRDQLTQSIIHLIIEELNEIGLEFYAGDVYCKKSPLAYKQNKGIVDLIENKCEIIIRDIAEMLTNLHHFIKKYFNSNCVSKIVLIETKTNTFRRWLILTDSNARWIYDPDRFQMESGFFNLCNLINNTQNTDLEQFEVPNIVVDEKFAIMDITQFYFLDEHPSDELDLQKLGQLLCMLYFLNSTEIDLSSIAYNQEAIIFTNLNCFNLGRNGIEDIDCYQDWIKSSVLNAGLLPVKLRFESSLDNEFSDYAPVYLENKHFERIFREEWSSMYVSLYDHYMKSENLCNEITNGFKKVYKFIMANTSVWLRYCTLSFDNRDMQYMFRRLDTYMTIRATALKLAVLSEGSYNVNDILPCHADYCCIQEIESHFLKCGELPRFKRKSKEKHIYSEACILENYFIDTFMEHIAYKAITASLQDMENQEKLILQSLER